MGHQQWASTGHRGHPARVREHETPLGIGRPQETYSLSLGRDFAATCKRGHRMACDGMSTSGDGIPLVVFHGGKITSITHGYPWRLNWPRPVGWNVLHAATTRKWDLFDAAFQSSATSPTEVTKAVNSEVGVGRPHGRQKSEQPSS